MNKLSKNYNDLMRWVMKDLQGLSKGDRKRIDKKYLYGSIGTLDMFGVVTTNEEFESFKADLESRIGMTFN